MTWTDFYPMNRIYDFLHGFLDFENAKRLIAYGIILILMMIVRPDGLLTRDSDAAALGCALEAPTMAEAPRPASRSRA